jgi:hypothetical protein
MGKNTDSHIYRKIAFIVPIGFLLSLGLIIATTPIHEAAHWVMSDIDPYVEPIEFHIFDQETFQNGEHILFSALGSVVIRENYPGAFDDRPGWADLLQEFICIFIQILITCIIVRKTFKLLFLRNQKSIRANASL